jgi:hypothetical protein
MLPAVPPTIVPTLNVAAAGMNSLFFGAASSSSSCTRLR